MKGQKEITVDEWYAELEKLEASQQPGDDGLTQKEIASRLKLSRERVREILGKAMEAGRLHVSRRPNMRIDGTRGSVPAYRILPAKKGA